MTCVPPLAPFLPTGCAGTSEWTNQQVLKRKSQTRRKLVRREEEGEDAMEGQQQRGSSECQRAARKPSKPAAAKGIKGAAKAAGLRPIRSSRKTAEQEEESDHGEESDQEGECSSGGDTESEVSNDENDFIC